MRLALRFPAGCVGPVRRGAAAGILILLQLSAFSSVASRALAADDFTGVKGRAAVGGQTAAGVVVYAFPDFDRGIDGEPAARSEATGDDGTFSLSLPPGAWFLVAARTAGGTLPGLRPGDLFCYFGGNPVRVESARTAVVGMSLARVETDPPAVERSGISGTVYDEGGKPLPGASVYLYKSPADGFKGVPGLFARTRPDGTFHLRVRKGTFFLVARRRASGDLFGPTQPGDHFGFYSRNPIVLADGEVKGVRVDALPRQALQEKLGKEFRLPDEIVVPVRAVDAGGNPVPGVRILAYRSGSMTGFPAYVSARSGKDGRVDLAVAEEGTYYLLAREKLGGPADGEWYGRYAGTADHSIAIVRGASGEPRVIVLEKR